MLDFNHPQLQYIFKASGIKEKIRPHLLRWRDDQKFQNITTQAITLELG